MKNDLMLPAVFYSSKALSAPDKLIANLVDNDQYNTALRGVILESISPGTFRDSSNMLKGTNTHALGGCAVKSKSRNYPVFLFLLASTMMLSCGGGDLNVGFGGGVFLPPVNTDFTAQESFSSEVEVVNQTLFNLTGKNGEITITGRSGVSSVMITAIKRIRSDSTQDAKEHLQGLEVEVQDLANEVRVETVQPRDTGGRKYEVDYTIIVPSFFEIRVSNVNGSVTINSIENDVTVNNTNGSVTLVEIVGSALVNLTSGIIESDVTLPLNGKIDLNTVNGNVALSIPVSTSAEFSAVVTNGNISVENLVLQNEVTTSTSRLGTLGSGQGTIDLTTGNGNIRVRGL